MTRTRHRGRGLCGEGCQTERGAADEQVSGATRHQLGGCGRSHQFTGRLGAGSLLESTALAKIDHGGASESSRSTFPVQGHLDSLVPMH